MSGKKWVSSWCRGERVDFSSDGAEIRGDGLRFLLCFLHVSYGFMCLAAMAVCFFYNYVLPLLYG